MSSDTPSQIVQDFLFTTAPVASTKKKKKKIDLTHISYLITVWVTANLLTDDSQRAKRDP